MCELRQQIRFNARNNCYCVLNCCGVSSLKQINATDSDDQRKSRKSYSRDQSVAHPHSHTNTHAHNRLWITKKLIRFLDENSFTLKRIAMIRDTESVCSALTMPSPENFGLTKCFAVILAMCPSTWFTDRLTHPQNSDKLNPPLVDSNHDVFSYNKWHLS